MEDSSVTENERLDAAKDYLERSPILTAIGKEHTKFLIETVERQQQEIERLKYWETDGKRENENLSRKFTYIRKRIDSEIAKRRRKDLSSFEKGVIRGLLKASEIVGR